MATSATSIDVVAKARQFCAAHLKGIASQLDKENRFPTELLPLLAQEGYWGLNYPPEFGGAGLDAVTTQKVGKEFAQVSAMDGNRCSAEVRFRKPEAQIPARPDSG
jgi:butyryl-CoA dehydrogenase